MSKQLVSVIIPIYNAEKYLSDCLRSVMEQSYRNLEILLINDGSTDNSYRKCVEYAAKDSRIRVLIRKMAECLQQEIWDSQMRGESMCCS